MLRQRIRSHRAHQQSQCIGFLTSSLSSPFRSFSLSSGCLQRLRQLLQVQRLLYLRKTLTLLDQYMLKIELMLPMHVRLILSLLPLLFLLTRVSLGKSRQCVRVHRRYKSRAHRHRPRARRLRDVAGPIVGAVNDKSVHGCTQNISVHAIIC
jgi:hypothetical protein